MQWLKHDSNEDITKKIFQILLPKGQILNSTVQKIMTLTSPLKINNTVKWKFNKNCVREGFSPKPSGHSAPSYKQINLP